MYMLTIISLLHLYLFVQKIDVKSSLVIYDISADTDCLDKGQLVEETPVLA